MSAIALLLNYVSATLPASAKVEPEKKPIRKRWCMWCPDKLTFLTILAGMGLVLGSLAAPASAATMAGGDYHSLAVRANGTVAAWGRNNYGQCTVPEPNEDFVAVAAGEEHSLGVKSDGTIVAWGRNSEGQCNIPAPNADFVAVDGGFRHSLGVKSDGSVVGWGSNTFSECIALEPNTGFTAVACGRYHGVGLRASPTSGVAPAWRDDVAGDGMLRIRSLAPNPVTRSAVITFACREAGALSLDIYDVSGRRTRTVPLGVLEPGVHCVRWDGWGASGEDAASGLYFVRVRSAAWQSRAAKLVLVR